VDGEGSMHWKLFGIIPVMTASGPNITRSAAGLVTAGTVWLPSALCSDEVTWTSFNPSQLHAKFAVNGELMELELVMDDRGRLKTITLPRCGNPEGAEFHYVDFGAVIENENTFNCYKIPTRLRAGWYFDMDRFESEGEFFRVIIDDAEYR
jgi:hypothetical protein